MIPACPFCRRRARPGSFPPSLDDGDFDLEPPRWACPACLRARCAAQVADLWRPVGLDALERPA